MPQQVIAVSNLLDHPAWAQRASVQKKVGPSLKKIQIFGPNSQIYPKIIILSHLNTGLASQVIAMLDQKRACLNTANIVYTV